LKVKEGGGKDMGGEVEGWGGGVGGRGCPGSPAPSLDGPSPQSLPQQPQPAPPGQPHHEGGVVIGAVAGHAGDDAGALRTGRGGEGGAAVGGARLDRNNATRRGVTRPNHGPPCDWAERAARHNPTLPNPFHNPQTPDPKKATGRDGEGKRQGYKERKHEVISPTLLVRMVRRGRT
jgi:hypothetical protein